MTLSSVMLACAMRLANADTGQSSPVSPDDQSHALHKRLCPDRPKNTARTTKVFTRLTTGSNGKIRMG